MNSAATKRPLFKNLSTLFSCVSVRRRVQIFLFFIMQLISAALEVVSIGAIVPFLSALTDINKLMKNEYIALLMDWTNITEPQQLIVALALIFSSAIIVANIFRFLTLYAQQYLSAVIAVDLGEMLFSKTLYKPYDYFLKSNTSHLIGTTTNDLNSVLGVMINTFTFITQGLIAISIAGGLLVYNTDIAIMLSIVIMIAYVLITLLVKGRLRNNSRISSDSYRNMVQTLQEGFGAIRYIILDRLQKNFTSEFIVHNKSFRRKNAENSVILQTPKMLMESVGVLAISAITISFTGHNKNISEIIPLMGFLVFGCYRLLPAVQQIFFAANSIISLSVSLDRIIEVIGVPLKKEDIKTVSHHMEMNTSLEFDHVFFDYHGTGEKWTIEDLSFTIKSKTTVALVGHTGSGKSTISDLILGLIQPQKGSIKVDGIALNPSNMAEWQAGISHVPQTIFLSDATVAENIAFGIPKKLIDMERVKKAAKMAQLDEFVQSLPEKYDENVGERGIRLSGGQRQRIGIARALYQDPSVIVFDEATSALDNKTEQDVVQAIGRLKENLTIVLIAHRLSTVQNADNILLFGKGRLLAQGTYEELLENSHFKELVISAEMS